MRDADGKDGETMTEKNEYEPHFHLMKYDGDYYNVLTWRPVGSIEGGDRSWRFITLEGKVINVRPVQLPSNANPLCVPEEVESSLRVVRHLVNTVNGSSSWSVFDPNPNPPDPKDYKRLMVRGLFEINLFIGMHTGKFPVLVPRLKGGYTEEKRAEIAKLLTDPNDPSTKMLLDILDFILKTCKPIKVPVDDGPVNVQDGQLRMVLEFIEDQVGKEIMLSVLQHGVEIACFDRPLTETETRNLLKNPGKMFFGRFDQWVKETMKTRGVSKDEAEQFLAKHVTFIAECKGKRFMHLYPIEDITIETDTMDGEDFDNFTSAGGTWNRRITPQVEPKTRQKPAEYKTPLAVEIFPDLMKRDQACRMLEISQATLTIWIKRGWIKKRGRGHIVRFRKTELIEAFQVYGKK